MHECVVTERAQVVVTSRTRLRLGRGCARGQRACQTWLRDGAQARERTDRQAWALVCQMRARFDVSSGGVTVTIGSTVRHS